MKTQLTTLLIVLAAAFAMAADDNALLNKLTNSSEAERNDALQTLLARGSTASVNQIAALLKNPKTFDSASFLLLSFATPEADQALYSALASATGREQAALLNALAGRGCDAAVGDAVQLVASPQPLRGSALNYLAKTATPEGCEALLKLASDPKNAGDLQIGDACLAAAERAYSSKRQAQALQLYTSLYNHNTPAHIKMAALSGLAAVDTKNQFKWLNQGLYSQPVDWQGAFASQAAKLPDANLKKFLDKLSSKIPASSEQILLGALIDNQRSAAMDYIRNVAKAAKNTESQRLAVTAIGQFGKAVELTELIALLDSPKAEIAEASRVTLSSASNPAINPTVLAALKRAKKSSNSEKSLIDIIALRQVPEATPLLVNALSSANVEIRTTALLALREQADETQVEAVLKAFNKAQAPAESDAAQKALFTLSRKYPGAATAGISAIYNESSPANKSALLQATGIAGDKAGIKLIETGLSEKNTEVSDNAMRVLASWKDPAALDLLLTQSASYPNTSLRVLTLRNYITLCENIEAPQQKLAALRKAQPLAARPEEKNLLAAALTTAEAAAKPTFSFKAKKIGNFRSEACAVADFNGNGKLDIVAGPYIYYAPDWKSFQFRPIGERKVDEQGKGYYDDFFNLVLDINKNGKPDLLTGCWFSEESQWYENPGAEQKMWTRHLIEKLGNHETGKLEDVDGDGKALEYVPHTHITCWYEIGQTPEGLPTMIRHTVSEKRNVLGVGVGDINGDGRPDIIRPDVWFEAPEDIRKGEWKAHPIELAKINGVIQHTSNIIVFDVNQDGLNDLICSVAHKHGIFWYEQVRGSDGAISWKQHLIDDSWSQAHYLATADLNNDGNMEIITGKRFMAHNGNDPDSGGTLCIYCYSFTPGANPAFTRHPISVGEGIGAGMNIAVVDIDGDGDLDLVTTGKFGGPILLENQLK